MRGAGHSDVDETRDAAVTHWFMAVGFAVATGFVASYLPWPWAFDINDPDFNPIVVLPLMLAGTSLWELARAITWTLRFRRFGTSTMQLTGPVPARLGRRLEGVIRTARPLRPEGPVRIALRCLDTHEFRDFASSATRTRKAETFVVWERAVEVAAHGLDTTRGIPFAFELPAAVGQPTSQAPARQGGSGFIFEFKAAITLPGFRRVWSGNSPPVARRWVLEASATMPGADFRARFVVPVEEA